MLDRLSEIEKKIDLQKFIYKDENLWPMFRTIIGSKLVIFQNSGEETPLKKSKIEKIKYILRYLGNIPIDISKLFRKYDYILLTTSDDYKKIDDKEINRLTGTLFEDKQEIKVLNIMKIFQNKKLPYTESRNETIIRDSTILIFLKIISLFIREGKEESITISKEFKSVGIKMVPEEVYRELRAYLALQYVYKILFKYIKPKAVITTCYGNYQVINIANKLRIPTVETQHGVILNHFAYTVTYDVNNTFYPKYLLVFGLRDQNYLKNKNYVQNINHIYPIGNMMVDYYKTKNNSEIKNLKNEYEYIIAISLEWTVAKEVIEYTVKQAKLYKNLCFVLIPRDKSDLKTYSANIENIKTFDKINCYEIVSNADYHMTCYSTCAIESLSLGVRNIFLNINGLSRRYYKDFIEKNIFNFIIEPDENIMDTVLLESAKDKKEIIESNIEYITPDYKQNIEHFYQNVLAKDKI